MTFPVKRSLRDNSLSSVFILGGSLAVIFFIIVFGIRVLDPRYDAWLFHGRNREDLIQHYLGWLLYRNSDWHFPITLIDNISNSEKIPVVYMDSIPLFAIIAKVFSPVLPDTFQYFGIYGVMCYFLMGGFSAVTVFRLTDDGAYSVLSSLLMSASIPMIFRTFWHTALGAHWIVAASLYLLLVNDKKSTLRSSVYWGALAFFAVSLQAYFLPMVFISLIFTALSDIVINGKGTWKRSLINIASFFASMLLTAWILGFFYGSVSNVGDYLGYYSFNYNAFFNTFGYSLLFKGLPLFWIGQYEGYAYPGACIYLLFLISVISRSRAKDRQQLFPREKRSLLIMYAMVFILFAGSNVLTFGEDYILIPMPKPILDIWQLFRSSGRMIWPVFYLLICLILVSFCRSFKDRRVRYVIIILCLVCHFVEFSPFIRAVHRQYYPRYESYRPLEDPSWDTIASRYGNIYICFGSQNMYLDSNLKMECLELTYFACEHDMAMNTTYLSRDNTDQINEETIRMVASGTLPDDTVFVFIDKDDTMGMELNFYELDGILVGTKDPL